MTLSIVIVNWNTRERVLTCLGSIYSAQLVRKFEVWVVDNASSDGSVEAIGSIFPEASLIRNTRNVGFAKACNQAIRASQGQYLFLLNSDAMLRRGSVDEMIEFMRANENVGALGPQLLNDDGSAQSSCARFPTVMSEALHLAGLGQKLVNDRKLNSQRKQGPRPVDWVSGAALLLRRDAISQVGLFDEDFFLYSEETELCWRLWQKGWEVWFLPSTTVYHLGGGSSALRPVENYEQLYLSKIHFFAKAYGQHAANKLRLVIRVGAFMKLIVWGIVIAARFPLDRESSAFKRFRREMALLR